MRIFALSDVHADFEPNARWLERLSLHEFQADLLILAGDVTDSLPLLGRCLELVARRFRHVSFVPGNHELWTRRDRPRIGSFEKFELVRETARNAGASLEAFRIGPVSIVPLLSWYDYSFGAPSSELEAGWMDFRACAWPAGCRAITERFMALNDASLAEPPPAADTPHSVVISFSHFLPRQELVPNHTAELGFDLSPVMGSALLDRQVRQTKSSIHVYGHSHVNRRLTIDGVTYVNNAFGYPDEAQIAAKRMLCIHEL